MEYSEINLTEEQKIQLKLENCLQYLKNTDWYYARKLETGEEVPVDVTIKRAEAREFIRANEGVTE